MSENQKPHVDQTAPNADVQGANLNSKEVNQAQQNIEPLTLEEQHQHEMSQVLANINDDIDSGKQGGLSQEEIAERKKQALIDERQNNIRKKTIGDNASRVASNGFSRAVIIGAISAVVVLGGATMYLTGGDDDIKSDMSGSVDLPKAKVSGNATLTKEQAAHARQEQQQQAQNAQQNGETYVPPVIVERDADMQYLVGDGVVPGVRVNVDENGQLIKDNGFSDVGLDPALGHNGGSAYSIADSASYGPETGNNGVNSTNNVNQANAQQSNQQQQQAPIVPTVAQDRYASNIQMLETAGKNADDWQNGIAETWLKRAAQTEEIAQTAFEAQFNEILSTKPKRDGASVGRANIHRHVSYLPKQVNNGANGNYSASGKSDNPQNYAAVNNFSNGTGSANSSDSQKKVLVRAGTSYITQLITEVNTDEGVEVMGRITNGPFKGAQIFGTVRQANKNIQFVFDRMIPKTGPELKITAVGREIGTNKLGMADEVKNHTFKRYAGMVLSSGMQGYGEAWSDIGTSSTTSFGTVQTKEKPNDREIGGRIVGQMGESVSQDIMKHTQRPPTYITYSGKVFNLFFSQNVTEPENK